MQLWRISQWWFALKITNICNTLAIFASHSNNFGFIKWSHDVLKIKFYSFCKLCAPWIFFWSHCTNHRLKTYLLVKALIFMRYMYAQQICKNNIILICIFNFSNTQKMQVWNLNSTFHAYSSISCTEFMIQLVRIIMNHLPDYWSSNSDSKIYFISSEYVS